MSPKCLCVKVEKNVDTIRWEATLVDKCFFRHYRAMCLCLDSVWLYCWLFTVTLSGPTDDGLTHSIRYSITFLTDEYFSCVWKEWIKGPRGLWRSSHSLYVKWSMRLNQEVRSGKGKKLFLHWHTATCTHIHKCMISGLKGIVLK